MIDPMHEYVMQGVVVAFRVVDGCLRRGDVIRLMNTKKEYQVDEVGVRTPAPVPVPPKVSCAFLICSTLFQIFLDSFSTLSQNCFNSFSTLCGSSCMAMLAPPHTLCLLATLS